MSEHTPGKWAYRYRPTGHLFWQGGIVIETERSGDPIAGMVGLGDANARLIAAAPELLKACEEFEDNAEGACPSCIAVAAERARAAIAKAKGCDT